MKKVILHIPHSSNKIPLKEGYIVDKITLGNEILKLTDWYTDDLFNLKTEISIVANFSRIFCDLERFSDDKQEVMSKYGMGVCYEKSDSGEVIREVSGELRETILNKYYWKFHRELLDAVNIQLEKYNKALIIDCHSFPNIPFERDLDKNINRPDFCIGTDAFHTPQNLIDISKAFFKEKGYSLGVNWPYEGTMVPISHFGKNINVQSIMLEINRKLYLKENSKEKTNQYLEIKKIVSEFINTIKSEFFS